MQSQLKVLEQLINQALKLDSDARNNLVVLKDKSVRIECYQPTIDIVISVVDDKVELLTHKNWQLKDREAVTAHLSGEFSAFLKLIVAEDKAAALINSELKLKGNSRLLIDLQSILTSIGIDWEYQLARLMGDIPAHFLGQMSRSSWQWLKQTHPIFVRHFKDFVTEEIAITPSQEAMDDYVNQVQALEQRLERLEAKVRRTIQVTLKAKDSNT